LPISDAAIEEMKQNPVLFTPQPHHARTDIHAACNEKAKQFEIGAVEEKHRRHDVMGCASGYEKRID